MGDSWVWAGYLYEEDDMAHGDDREKDGLSWKDDFKIPDPVDDHNYAKAIKAAGAGPFGKTTSQADVMRAQGGINVSPSKILDVAKQPAVWAERLSPNSARLEFEGLPNEQAVKVVLEVLPKVLELYLKKSGDYGGASGGLGPKAPFVDIWRKVLKLKRALWEDEELQFEQTDEILSDLIGTCLNILLELK
jgi:hypothetical protein